MSDRPILAGRQEYSRYQSKERGQRTFFLNKGWFQLRKGAPPLQPRFSSKFNATREPGKRRDWVSERDTSVKL